MSRSGFLLGLKEAIIDGSIKTELNVLKMETFEQRVRRGGSAAIAEAEKFFMHSGAVHQTLIKISERLRDLGIPYAVVGGMAVSAHGVLRTTEDVDILVTADDLITIHKQLEGLGYVPPFQGSKHLKDVETSVPIEFLVAGQFPGDGKPKPVAFPDPRSVSVEIDGIRYLNFTTLVELKLASGMTNAGRLKDLSDVQEFIRRLRLKRDFGLQLNEYVRPKYFELWDSVATSFDPDK
jgi:Uncharacterised nucleotidyltransferase